MTHKIEKGIGTLLLIIFLLVEQFGCSVVFTALSDFHRYTNLKESCIQAMF